VRQELRNGWTLRLGPLTHGAACGDRSFPRPAGLAVGVAIGAPVVI
jgi:hypothetical protein